MLGTNDPRLEKVYTAPKGAKFRIINRGPLFHIHMENGGVRPEITLEAFTSHKRAEQALERYFANNPKPVPRDEKKNTD